MVQFYQSKRTSCQVESFRTWLLGELKKRDWTNAELARRSGLSEGGLGNVINGRRNPTPDTCRKIAKALKIPESEVFRRAGILHEPPPPEENLTLGEILEYLSEFDDDELDALKEYIEYRYQVQKQRGLLKPRRSGSAG